MGILGEKKMKSCSLSTSPCANLRTAYHNCFNKWYADKFLKGQWDNQECASQWQKYRDCLAKHLDDKHLARFLEADGIDDFTNFTDSANPTANS